jgi:hypothetical protein
MENETQNRPCCGAQVGADENVPADLKEKMGRAATTRHCDVCFLLDGNLTPKQVLYCKLCDAFMCEPCRKSPGRRLGAKIARTMRKILNGNRMPRLESK